MIHRMALVGVLAVLLVAGVGDAQPECRSVVGTFVNHAVPPPECGSPVLFCTHGELSGDLEAGYDFTMMSQSPDPDGPPVTMTFTGESVITLVDGTMLADDHGWITFRVLEPSVFETTVVIHDGTGAHVGATGSLVAQGEYDLVSGQGSGTYRGTICG